MGLTCRSRHRRPSAVFLGSALLGTAVTAVALLLPPAAPAAAGPPADVTSLAGTDLTVQPESAGGRFTGSANGVHLVHDPGLGLWRNGKASGTVTTTQRSDALHVLAGADRCRRGARMLVSVDGRTVLRQLVDVDLGRYAIDGSWPRGEHAVAIRFTNDRYEGPGCDRNLKIYSVSFIHRDPPSRIAVLGSPSLLRVPEEAGTSYHYSPLGIPAQLLWSNGWLTADVTTQTMKAASLIVNADGEPCDGDARMRLYLDGRNVGEFDVPPTRHGQHERYVAKLPRSLAAGRHRLGIQFVNDRRTEACDRNLKVSTVGFVDRA